MPADSTLNVRDMQTFQTMFGPEGSFLATVSFTSGSGATTDFTVNGTSGLLPGTSARWHITDVIVVTGAYSFDATRILTLSTASGTFFTLPIVGASSSTFVSNLAHFKFRKPLRTLGSNEKLTATWAGSGVGGTYVTLLGYVAG